MDDSIYPSDTVDILQRPEDDEDDLSTLSGCSSSHGHSSSFSAAGETPAGHKRFHSSPLRNKTILQPYLNGKLPMQVSAALKMCNEHKLLLVGDKDNTATRNQGKCIPGAISISTTSLSNETPILGSSRNSESDGVSRGESIKEQEHELSYPPLQLLIGDDTKHSSFSHGNKEKDIQSLDIQKTTSYSDSRITCRSPVKGNAARQQRLQRLRRLKFGGGDAAPPLRKPIPSNSLHVPEAKSNDVSTPQLARKSDNSSCDSFPHEKECKKEDLPVLGKHNSVKGGIYSGCGKTSQEMDDSVISVKSSSNGSKVFDILQDELVKPSLVKKQLHLTPKSKQSLLDTLPNIPAFLNGEGHGTPGATSSLAGLYNDLSNSYRHATTGRIHRSFWSVVEPDSHVVSGGVNNPPSNSSMPFPSPQKISSNVNTNTCDRQGDERTAPIVRGMENSPNSLSRRSAHSNNSWTSNVSHKSEQAKSYEKSSPALSTKSTKSVDSCNKTGKCSPQRSTVSMKSFDDFYDGVLKKLQCNTVTCSEGCEAIDIIDEPPTLKRLMLARDLCGNVPGYGSNDSRGSDGVSAVSSTASSIFSDVIGNKRKSKGYNDPTEIAAGSEKLADTESSINDDKFQSTSSGNGTMKDSDIYIAQISIGITGQSKHYFNNVIAELQKDLESAGINKDSVSIRLVSPSEKGSNGSPCSAPSTPADNTVITRSTISEECSLFNDSNSGRGSKVSASTLETMTVFAANHDKPKEGDTKPMRQLRRSILATPSRNIVKKIRKATDHMLRRTQQRRHSLKLDDEHHLLSDEDIWDLQGPEEDPWYHPTSMSTNNPRCFDQGRYSKMAC